MTALWLIVLCGLLAVAYGAWATMSVMSADAGSAKMQEISAAVREGAQAYLKRQYTTIGVVGIVIFFILAYFLGASVAGGFFFGAGVSGGAGFLGKKKFSTRPSPPPPAAVPPVPPGVRRGVSD